MAGGVSELAGWYRLAPISQEEAKERGVDDYMPYAGAIGRAWFDHTYQQLAGLFYCDGDWHKLVPYQEELIPITPSDDVLAAWCVRELTK